MSKKIIDDINKLVKMSREELDETLLKEKYNKANLRELIRRLTKETKLYEDLFLADYTEKIPGDLSKLIMSIEAVEGIENYYLHRNWHDGSIELNIEFNSAADRVLEYTDIKERGSCAFWE